MEFSSKVGKVVVLGIRLAVLVAMVLAASTASMAQVGAPSWWNSVNNDTVSLSFLFDQNTWVPQANSQVTPGWYAGTTWNRFGQKTPQWASQLSGHNGVMGITDGGAGVGTLEVTLDNEARPNWIKHVWIQYDVYVVGAAVCCNRLVGQAGTISNEHGTVEDLQYGWQRVTGSFDIYPQPDWEKFQWEFTVQSAGKAAIDNLYIGAHCEVVPEPSALATLSASLLGLACLARRKRL